MYSCMNHGTHEYSIEHSHILHVTYYFLISFTKLKITLKFQTLMLNKIHSSNYL